MNPALGTNPGAPATPRVPVGLKKPVSPYPPNFAWWEITSPSAFASGATVFNKQLVQVQLSDECNLGMINGSFTQEVFDHIYLESYAADIPFMDVNAAYQKALQAAGIGTLPPGPAGSYLEE
jgi:hypothetical protein